VIHIKKACIVNKLLQENSGIFDTSQAVQAGVSKTTLGNFVKNGILERIAHGRYARFDAFPDELFILQRRSKKIIFSHETALFLHDMAVRTPILHSVTVPSDSKLSTALVDRCKVFYVKPELHSLGICSLPSKMGHFVTVYNIERTICDVLRSRNRMDSQTVAGAMKGYAVRKDINWSLLSKYARIFKVTKMMRQYLEVLV
jgi:predicted transcriptional regulator of viral defense system